MRVEFLGDGFHALLMFGECQLHQRLDELAAFAGRHHLIEFEKHLGRDGEGGSRLLRVIICSNTAYDTPPRKLLKKRGPVTCEVQKLARPSQDF